MFLAERAETAHLAHFLLPTEALADTIIQLLAVAICQPVIYLLMKGEDIMQAQARRHKMAYSLEGEVEVQARVWEAKAFTVVAVAAETLALAVLL